LNDTYAVKRRCNFVIAKQRYLYGSASPAAFCNGPQRAKSCRGKGTTGEILHLISTKYMPILLYRLDVCPVTVADTRSLWVLFKLDF